MFAPHLKRLYRTCDIIVRRNLRNSGNIPKHNNPGLNKQIKAFNQDGIEVTEGNAEQFINESESDFYNVGGSFTEHVKETLMGKLEMRHHIVKQKYFKENMPNLLTWSEKEQIRLLASTQPDEWTPEKIAESFPVTVPIVKKLLKYPWKPASEQRIARHDASVMRNWKELKENTFELPEDIQKHFLKFSDRTIPPLSKQSLKIDITQEEKIGEFERIVQRCASNATSKENHSEKNTLLAIDDAKVKENKKAYRNYTRTTLDELATKIKSRLETGKDVDLPDQILLNTTEVKTIKKNDDESKEIELFNDDEKKEKLTVYKEEDDGKTIMNYPERIRIPKKAYKKNATYKVNDCYYDHDGRFLYRVLGMF